MTRARTLAVALATVTGLVAAPAAASAKTVIGTGSSVAEPYLRALFAGYHKVKPKIHFIYTADGGNAGVKDVQQNRATFAVNVTDPDSHYMKTTDSYVQGYNAQAVATEEQVVIAAEITTSTVDWSQLDPMVSAATVACPLYV